MGKGVNKVILIGNLGQDPELRYMPDGTGVLNLTLATSDTWKDRQTGEKKERTEWHRICVFGKLSEIISQYCRKGSKLYVEGALRTRKWQDNQGQDRYTTEIVVGMDGRIQMLDGAPQTGQQPQQRPPQQTPTQQGYQPPASAQQSGFDDFDDDIPF